MRERPNRTATATERQVASTPRGGWWIPVVVGASVGLCLLLACDRVEPDSERSSADRIPNPQSPIPNPQSAIRHSTSPSETVRLIHGHRVSGRLQLLAEFLLPEQQAQVLDLIRAVDRLTRANHVLQAAVLQHIGAGSASVFDRSQVANMIGVFSRDVAIVGERTEGDSAVVTIQVADRVPLEEVHLVRRGGPLSPHRGWALRTDPPIDGLAKELRNLAGVLIETARRLEREPMAADQLKRELELRQAAIWRRLTAVIDGASHGGPTSPTPDDP